MYDIFSLFSQYKIKFYLSLLLCIICAGYLLIVIILTVLTFLDAYFNKPKLFEKPKKINQLTAYKPDLSKRVSLENK